MAGKTVSIPAEINKTYSTAGSVTILLYMLFPDTMIGWNFQNGANNYIPDKYKALPILGGWQRQGRETANYESVISKGPNIVFVGHEGDNDTINSIPQKFGQIPAVDIEEDNNLTNSIPSIIFVGTVLGNES